MINEELMDALCIVEGEIVSVISPSYGVPIAIDCYVTKNMDEGIMIGSMCNRNIIITSYKYMNEESALLNKPIRLKIDVNKDDR